MSDFLTPDEAVYERRVLDPADLVSPVWRKIKAHLERQRDALRAQNDSISLDPIATAALRGRIQAITNLLEVGSQPPADATDDVAI